MRRYTGVIGYPLKHSISPAFQQAAFDFCRVDVQYQAWETGPDRLTSKVLELRQDSCLGANVTIPFKEQVLGMLDNVDPLAREIGAVNTILNENGRLSGYNTDAVGFMRALELYGNFDPADRRVVVLGAGGAARAVCFSLVRGGARRLDIINRDPARGGKLKSFLDGIAGSGRSGKKVSLLSYGGREFEETLAAADLIVNCTPLGMKSSAGEGQSPLEARFISGKALVYDLVYNPMKTRLLADAERAGAHIVGGLPMLVFQGAASFKIWTRVDAPLAVMFRAAAGALEAVRA